MHIRIHNGELPDPIKTLERYFQNGGITLLQAVFENTFFAAPDSVRGQTPRFPGFARKSREHYPGVDKGKEATWQGQPVRLDDNSRAQMAWKKYSGQPIARGSGYGVRHIWGEPWNPMAFTAGWNLAYMPFWAGMLTEDQHPHPQVQSAIKQASWDLYFKNSPVCVTPDFVRDPDIDLAELLGNQPLLILQPSVSVLTAFRNGGENGQNSFLGTAEETVRNIRRERNASWSNLKKAACSLQGLQHAPFGTKKVESSSKSIVRRMIKDTGLDLTALHSLLESMATE